jgi:hypothetical protein
MPVKPNSSLCARGLPPAAIPRVIRKTYPLDDTGTLSQVIGEMTTQTQCLQPRSIPFSASFQPKDPEKTEDSADRGLVFAAYQTSITEPFKFVQAAWANNPTFEDVPKGRATRFHTI